MCLVLCIGLDSPVKKSSLLPTISPALHLSTSISVALTYEQIHTRALLSWTRHPVCHSFTQQKREKKSSQLAAAAASPFDFDSLPFGLCTRAAQLLRRTVIILVCAFTAYMYVQLYSSMTFLKLFEANFNFIVPGFCSIRHITQCYSGGKFVCVERVSAIHCHHYYYWALAMCKRNTLLQVFCHVYYSWQFYFYSITCASIFVVVFV